MQPREDRPRATRYVMSAPILFRLLDAEGWQEGRTVNVSRTGVLFESAAPGLSADTKIEFILLLPSLGLPGHARVRCLGQVVRQGREPLGGGCAMAAAIDAYEFLGIASETVPGSTAAGAC